MEGSDDNVAATNDTAANSKAIAVRKGYYVDTFIDFFVGNPTPSSPLMNRGTTARALVIRELIERFLDPLKAEEGQIVVYGAGFDTNYFRLQQKQATFRSYYEIDFHSVVSAKSRVIQRVSALSALLSDMVVLPQNTGITSRRYHLLAADLRDLDTVEALLKGVGFQADLPTLFISEAVLMYTNPVDSERLISWSGRSVSRSMFAIYEPIQPHDSFGKMMVENLKRRGVPLASIQKYPTLDDQRDRLRRCGFEHAEAATMREVYGRLLSGEDQARISRIEFMDEFEEFYLLMAHYCIAVGHTNTPQARDWWGDDLLTRFSQAMGQ